MHSGVASTLGLFPLLLWTLRHRPFPVDAPLSYWSHGNSAFTWAQCPSGHPFLGTEPRGPTGNQLCSQERGPASRHLRVQPQASPTEAGAQGGGLGGVTACGPWA